MPLAIYSGLKAATNMSSYIVNGVKNIVAESVRNMRYEQ